MEVFTLIGIYDNDGLYEGQSILGIYSSYSLAESAQALHKHQWNRPYYTYKIVTYGLDLSPSQGTS